MATQLYETDFYGWTQEQTGKLRKLLTERSNLDLHVENILEAGNAWKEQMLVGVERRG